MSELIKFKAWLTLDEAANYLSIIFSEKISISDILRLALDGHLKLSVNFVNGAYARKGNRLLYEDAEKVEIPSLDGDSNVPIVCGLKFSKQETGIVEEVVQFDKKVIMIYGIWDLTMIGGERLDLEHEFQMLTNGPSIELVNIDGCYIEDYSNGTIYELQASFEDNQFSAGSLAQLEDIKRKIAINNIPKGKAELLIKKHELDRKEFLKNARKQSDASNYYPPSNLPDNAVLVVRTNAISEFIKLDTGKKIFKPMVNSVDITDKIRTPMHLNCFDISFWLRLDFWSKEQAAFILCNIVPDTFVKDKLGNETFWDFSNGSYSSDGNGDGGVDGFYDRFYVHECCLRLIEGKDYYSKSPSEWIERAVSKKVIISWLEFAIREGFYVPKQDNTVKQLVEKPLSDKERESMIKIIHALAKNGYKYPNHGALAEIVRDFETNNNGVTENTLTKYLKEFGSL